MEGNLEITLLMVITVVAGISAQVIADYLKVPSIVFLLLFGMAMGPSALGILHPSLLGNGLEVMVSLCVALILFEGGLNLQLREMEEVSTSLRNLVTVGALVTLFGGGLAAHWLSEFPWQIAFLYASLVVVTGPTVVAPLLKQVNADRQVSTLLEGEGVLIDPVGAILAVVVLNIVLQGNADPFTIVSGLLLRLGIGGMIGIGGGWLLGLFLIKARFLSEDLKNLSVLAGLWGLFGLSQALISESGLMTAVAAGIMLKIAALPEERLLLRFKNQLSILAISVLFILLSADLSIASIFALGWGGILTVAALMLIVRPLNILVSTWSSDLTWRQKAFLAWVAPRGIVAASVASLFAISLTKQGINGGDAIKALVFLTILLTVFLQGLTARWVADWLRVRSDEATGAMIVGCNPFGRMVAHLIKDQGETVVMIDANPEYCKQAKAENLRVYRTSALNMDALNEIGVARVGTFLTTTSNSEVNSVLAQRVKEEFRPPRVLAVYPDQSRHLGVAEPAEKLASPGVKRAFSSRLSIKEWSQYLSTNEVKITNTELNMDEHKFQRQRDHLQALINAGTVIPLLIQRQGQLRIATADEEWQPGDRITYGLHIPKPKLGLAMAREAVPAPS
ncbi:MAG: sodium:proton antiporter [Acaryochloris sp. RU_4_1]|nr:sodium:proton antiporter [Acaryochloris sp. RU_4_1]NJR53806.1 sodium:proton antiporter [Acaryochloris sp. CRU_2_0]